jgi:predicted lipoprotein with Yx(FWY)xxD motif
LVSGDGVDGSWFLAKPEYSVMIVNSQLTGLDGNNYRSDYTAGTGISNYFTDGQGRTLYTFTLDRANTNTFTKSDLSNDGIWPVYENNQGIIVPSTLNKSDFGTINVFGKNQLTFKGWPLYYFGQDGNTRGANKGISFPRPGIWHVPSQNIQAAP